MSSERPVRAQRGIQSIEVGGKVLLAMVQGGRPMALKEIAHSAGMPAAKVHPYLVSFSRIGLIEQAGASGLYGLGPLALQLGLIGLKQAEPVQVASAAIVELARKTGLTIAICVWGSGGATIVRLAESPAPIHVNMRHGTVFSLAGTASGRLFAAYLGAAEMQRALALERRRRRADPEPAYAGMPAARPVPSWRDFEPALAEVRAIGMSRSKGETLPGVNAMAAPVFDHTGAIALVLTAIGPAGIFDIAWKAPIANALRRCAAAVSERLGARHED